MILCDIGNTSTKFFIDKNIKSYYKNDKIPKFKDDIFYISVNEKATKKLLKKNPHATNLASFIDFKTSYVGLGVDRAVACCFEEISKLPEIESEKKWEKKFSNSEDLLSNLANTALNDFKKNKCIELK